MFTEGNTLLAFLLTLFAGLSTGVGSALAGFFLLRAARGEAGFGIIFAGGAGIMVYISLDELLPTAERYGEHHVCIYGLIAGMAVMALSLILIN